jgi:hypothetical protein
MQCRHALLARCRRCHTQTAAAAGVPSCVQCSRQLMDSGTRYCCLYCKIHASGSAQGLLLDPAKPPAARGPANSMAVVDASAACASAALLAAAASVEGKQQQRNSGSGSGSGGGGGQQAGAGGTRRRSPAPRRNSSGGLPPRPPPAAELHVSGKAASRGLAPSPPASGGRARVVYRDGGGKFTSRRPEVAAGGFDQPAAGWFCALCLLSCCCCLAGWWLVDCRMDGPPATDESEQSMAGRMLLHAPASCIWQGAINELPTSASPTPTLPAAWQITPHLQLRPPPRTHQHQPAS